MEKEPSFEQLPPPTGLAVPLEQLGNIPADPAIMAQPENLPYKDYNHADALENEVESYGEEYSGSEDEEANYPKDELVDVGSLDLAPIGEMVDNLRVSYHGLRFSISRVRENRARQKATKIISNTRRKDMMYGELSRAADARNNPHFDTKKERLDATEDARKRAAEAATPIIRPETVVERHLDRRQDKKRRKALEKEFAAQIVASGYRGNKHAEGVTKSERRKERLSIATSSMSAAEKRQAKNKLGAKRNTSPTDTQRIAERRRVKSATSFEKTIEQPITARYRAFRRHSAVDRMTRHQQRAQKHLQKARDIRS